MDPNYNQYAAQALMDQGYCDARKSIHDAMPVVDFQLEDHRVVYVEQPRSWRITRTNSTEEQNFYVYGAICRNELPPIKLSDATPSMKKKAIYLRQGVRITGLRSNGFNDDAVSIKHVHEMMKTYLKKEDIEVKPWNLSMYEGHWAVDASTRYFTPRKHAPTEAGLAFDMGVDPDGVLAHMRGDDLIHTMDNKVDYLREVKNDNGTR
ncbi:hypothetical protein JR316_0006336 [Psilocybe cubensis]|uniref:Uncharacterized protein n=2 Tax=Psilocybe cubensis TaxID=181762 RepID=A0A8H7Y0Y8_PSICU|nr:hypothetical protein JR316_0006336 [Psilocybe cubensis]KAH9481809.1 hypothetical protein JR316_0006336 [Psilocybe cubensis]